MKNLRLFALAGVFAFVPTIFAQVVYTTFGPGMTYDTSVGYNVTGDAAPLGKQELAAAFTPTASGTLSSVDVALGYRTPGSSFTLSIFSDSLGAPGAALVMAAPFTPTQADSDPISDVNNVSFSGLSLVAGTQYWLDAVATTDSDYCAWNPSFTAGGFDYQNFLTSGWTATSGKTQLAFDVNIAPVPEPAPIFGLLGGGAGLLLLRRKK